ncbi:hypothetical protein DFJ73DRAFT_775282 [Zopfochytrium polystomum]|nr:hypothetical protein DFJ73DRAFT_775282 [Zopfochytrium polystomum]
MRRAPQLQYSIMMDDPSAVGKWVFVFAIGMFEVGSLLCDVATLMEVLIIDCGHIVLIQDRSKYEGVFTATFGLSSLIGLLIGGSSGVVSTSLFECSACMERGGAHVFPAFMDTFLRQQHFLHIVHDAYFNMDLLLFLFYANPNNSKDVHSSDTLPSAASNPVQLLLSCANPTDPLPAPPPTDTPHCHSTSSIPLLRCTSQSTIPTHTPCAAHTCTSAIATRISLPSLPVKRACCGAPWGRPGSRPKATPSARNGSSVSARQLLTLARQAATTTSLTDLNAYARFAYSSLSASWSLQARRPPDGLKVGEELQCVGEEDFGVTAAAPKDGRQAVKVRA